MPVVGLCVTSWEKLEQEAREREATSESFTFIMKPFSSNSKWSRDSVCVHTRICAFVCISGVEFISWLQLRSLEAFSKKLVSRGGLDVCSCCLAPYEISVLGDRRIALAAGWLVCGRLAQHWPLHLCLH
ncbi:hypothetical protein ATANTOWER_001213 [Ataeniobius toweri]|uniref:Uncharacterized protein n=1 Tax=Ataeniobius toweri TaxID=208326 RepID=A0ABU7AEB0_9TELE|nr:hypothetical protein [Ataeniobius toweri]